MTDTASAALAFGVHVTAVGEDLVFLDLRKDAYLCLPAGRAILAVAPDGRIGSSDPGIAAAMAALGLCDRAERPGAVRQPHLSPPSRDIEDDPVRPLRWRDLPGVLWLLFDTFALYRGRGLAALIARTGARRPARRPPVRGLEDEVRRFRRLSLWTPVDRKCLLQSFLLLRHLRRAGHSAAWVFAVRTWPFAAHCWLQCGDTILDDRFDRLAAYAPILTVPA